MKFVPLQLTHLILDGDEHPPNLGWKDLGRLRILEVIQDQHQGKVQICFGLNGTRVMLVASETEGFALTEA